MAIFIPHSPFEVKSAFGEFPIPQTKMFDGELEALLSGFAPKNPQNYKLYTDFWTEFLIFFFL